MLTPAFATRRAMSASSPGRSSASTTTTSRSAVIARLEMASAWRAAPAWGTRTCSSAFSCAPVQVAAAMFTPASLIAAATAASAPGSLSTSMSRSMATGSSPWVSCLSPHHPQWAAGPQPPTRADRGLGPHDAGIVPAHEAPMAVERAGARVAGWGEVVRSNDSHVIHPQTVDNVCGRAVDRPRSERSPDPVSGRERAPSRWTRGLRSGARSRETALGDSFTHLHVHTEYSMLDGAARVDDVVAAAAADGQPAIGITDHGNMYGILPFYKACQEHGVKPILGTEAYMAHDSRHERPSRRGRMDDTGGDAGGGKKLYYHLTLLAESNAGYRNLIQLSSRAYLEGYYYKPRLDWELLEQHSEGVIATTGCLGGHVLQSLMRGDEEGALKQAGRLQDIFGRDNLFVEIQDHGIPEQHRTNPQLFEIARRIGAPLVATNDSHYTHREDAVAHDALLCVQTGSLMSDPDRFKFSGNDHYLKSATEMRRLFVEVPEACDNSLWIAER